MGNNNKSRCLKSSKINQQTKISTTTTADTGAQGKLHRGDNERKPPAQQKDPPPNPVNKGFQLPKIEKFHVPGFRSDSQRTKIQGKHMGKHELFLAIKFNLAQI